MSIKSIILTLAILLGGSITGCKIDQENKIEIASANVKQVVLDLRNARSENDKEWQQFKSDAELKINANGNRIDEFKAETKAGNSIKDNFKQVAMLIEKNNIGLMKKLNGYKYEGKDDWKHFKLALNKDIEVVANSIEDLYAKNG